MSHKKKIYIKQKYFLSTEKILSSRYFENQLRGVFSDISCEMDLGKKIK